MSQLVLGLSSEDGGARQRPTTGEPAYEIGELLRCAIHPAVRIGFLDALAGRPLHHDRIMDRIEAETPATSLRRLGWSSGWDIRVAQYRYEEGRCLVLELGLRCKAWGYPDFPPKQVMDQLRQWSIERPKKSMRGLLGTRVPTLRERNG